MAFHLSSNVHQIVWEVEIPSDHEICKCITFIFRNVVVWFELRHRKNRPNGSVYYELHMMSAVQQHFSPFNFISYIEDSDMAFFRTQVVRETPTHLRLFRESNPKVNFKANGKIKIIMIFGGNAHTLKCVKAKSFKNIAVGPDSALDSTNAGPDSKKPLLDIESLTYELSNLDLLSRDFSKLLDGDLYSDVEVNCSDQTFKAHRAVLCSRSEVFLAMLQSDMLEGRTAQVEVKDMKSDVCKELLHYIYSGILLELTPENARGLYEAGDRYNVSGLMKPCAIYLTKNLTLDNAYEMLVLADAHSDKDFKENVIDYVLSKNIPGKDDIWKDFCCSQPVLANQVLDKFYKRCAKNCCL